VAHAWAQQSTKKSGSAGNVSFHGPSYLSYATEVARFHTSKKSRAVLFTSRRYSVTTSCHVQAAQSAVCGLDVQTFTVPNVDPRSANDHNWNWRHYMDQIRENAGKAKRTTKYKDIYLVAAREYIEKANAYAKFFGLRKSLPSDLDEIERMARKVGLIN
jgi:hypothetical protein